MKPLFHASRILTGLVFVFSGIVKAIDPMGSAFKFEEYFLQIFNAQSLISLSLPLAFLLSALEFTVGIMLIFNLLPKLTSYIFWGLMIVFTPLTLYLAITNYVSDCGCFGDAVKLTNWQTFGKNLIIIALFLPYFFLKNKYKTRLKTKTQKIIIATSFLAILSFEQYNYSYLPVIDFRPYKVGVNIREKMQIPPDAPKDEYKTILVYKNKQTGEVKEFTEDNYPWQDSTWEWLDTKNILVKKGYVPPIHDFVLHTRDGRDITDSILNAPKVILVDVYNLQTANIRGLYKLNELLTYIKTHNIDIPVYCLTASSWEDTDFFVKKFSLVNCRFLKADETMLKTMIRSNPGFVFLRKGTIIKKVHFHSLNSKNLAKILEF